MCYTYEYLNNTTVKNIGGNRDWVTVGSFNHTLFGFIIFIIYNEVGQIGN